MEELILHAPPDDITDFLDIAGGGGADESTQAFHFKQHVDGVASQVEQIGEKLNGVSKFYSSVSRKQGCLVGKDKDRHVTSSIKKHQQEAAKRMQELMRQFAAILRQLTQHKLAWPFMQPVDVKGLELHDYYEVIDKPMDFSTIKNQMETKDGTGYKNVCEIYADVRLVFKNATTYNEEKSDVHTMAQTLLDKFEEKWLRLLPKVVEENHSIKRISPIRVNIMVNMHLFLLKEEPILLYEVDMHLDELREMVVQKCRKMSAEDKMKLGSGLSRLSPEDLSKALEIISQKNPNFQAEAEEVNIDMDAQSESTLWRLKVLVKDALEVKAKSPANNLCSDNSKRKREICDALAKTAKKRSKKTQL